MLDFAGKLKPVLLELLAVDYEKTAAHITEELKVEYPALYQEIIDSYANSYNIGGCGLQMSPATVVQQSLNALSEEGLVKKTQVNGISQWSLANQY